MDVCSTLRVHVPVFLFQGVYEPNSAMHGAFGDSVVKQVAPALTCKASQKASTAPLQQQTLKRVQARKLGHFRIWVFLSGHWAVLAPKFLNIIPWVHLIRVVPGTREMHLRGKRRLSFNKPCVNPKTPVNLQKASNLCECPV